jgi:hypothetical protein
VYPSGSDFATMALPIVPPAPTRFSTTIGCPSCIDNSSSTIRCTMSVELPAPTGTIARSGLVGHVCAAPSKTNDDSANAEIANR